MTNVEPEEPNSGDNNDNTNKRDTHMFGRKKSSNAENFLKQLGEILGVDPEDMTVVNGATIEQGGRMHVREFTEDEINDARKDLEQLERQAEERQIALEARRAAAADVERKVNEDGIEITDLTTENFETGIVTSLGTVPINTPNFKTTAFGLYDLPGDQVMQAMSAPENEKMVSFMKLLKTAILEPQKLKDLEMLSFLELTDVLGDWMEQSTQAAVSRQGKHGHAGPSF